MSVLLHQFFGPFSVTTFALVQEFDGGAYFLQWDTGSEFDVLNVVGDQVSAFKFLPGTIAEIKISSLTNKRLQIDARQIPLVPVSAAGAKVATAATAIGMDQFCGSPGCGSIPCPDPSKPLMKCPGNPPVPGCYEPQNDG